MQIYRILFFISFALFFSSLSYAQEAYVSNQFIVQCRFNANFLNEIEKAQSDGLLPAITRANRLAPGFNVWLIETQSGTNDLETLKKFENLSFVELVQFNHEVSLRETTPNDPSFNQQYSLKNTGQSGGTAGADIDATLAWDITTGGLTALGDTIVVAVIDGGCQLNHPDLAANIWVNRQEIPGNGIDDDNNGYVDDINGWNAFNNTGNIPNNQHGTHVSGIIGARGNNNVGVSGVNWNVKLMEIAGSSGNEATVVAAYLYAATQRKLYNQTNGAKGAYVVATNSSFGVDYGQASNFPIWCAMYDTLGKYGVISAGATINGNVNVDQQGDIPTTCASNFLVSVTNSTRNDTKLNGAGFGLVNIDLASPGTDVYNTVNNSGYSALTGTSMATPHVAGVLGLMYAAACQELIADARINPELIALQMKNYLLEGADVISSMANFVNGSRRLNALGALQRVQTYICNPDVPPVTNFSASNLSGCPGLTVSFNNLSSLNADSYEWIFPGGVPSTSTAASPTVSYTTFGTYDVTLITTNEFGSDTLVKPAYVNVNNSGLVDAFTETFEGESLQSMGWNTVNPDGLNTWALFNVQGTTPGTRAVGINIFNNQANSGQRDRLISPAIELNQTTNNRLYFTHAHRRRVTSVRDSLIILVSVDDGETFPYRVFARAENGQGSFATAGLLTTNFVPTQTSDWCLAGTVGTACLNVDLSAFDGQTIRLAFEALNNGGNNIYLDNIRITGNCSTPNSTPPVATFNVSKPKVCQGQSIVFTDQSTNNPTFRFWTFNGGTPASSVQPNVTVTFNTPGIYTAQLISGNAGGTDTTTTTIEVFENPSAPVITFVNNQIEVNTSGTLIWFLNGQPYFPPTPAPFTPTQQGVYTVTFTDANGCAATSNALDLTTLSTLSTDDEKVEVFPNPADELVQLKWSRTTSARVSLMDISGRLVYTQSVENQTLLQINTTQLAQGIYQLKIENKGSLARTFKIIVKH